MSVLIVGGAGFVGLNVAEACLAAGLDVLVLDRSEPPEAARLAFAALPGRFETIRGDVTDAAALDEAIRPGLDAVVLGAAITADAERDAREPEAILRVNVLSQVPILERARAAGVRRVVNLSSGSAYGRAGTRAPLLDEAFPADPESLYAISKFASERVVERLGRLWGLDTVSVRLSGVFGPWERPTGVRDTLSPHHQVVTLAESGRPAILERPGLRDWIYGPDVGDAVLALLRAERLAHRLYNVSSPRAWSVLDWGRHLGLCMPGFVCRMAEPGETPTIRTPAALDRSPLDTRRLAAETGWSARFGLADSADHLAAWRSRHGAALGAGP